MPKGLKQHHEDSPSQVKSGVFMFPNGDKYDGEYRSLHSGIIERSGKGVHITAEGSVYRGTWANDRMVKTGSIHFTSGAIYEGEVLDNCFHGNGRYTWPNGSFFEGVFQKNRLSGNGMFTDSTGQVWCGVFLGDKAPGLRFKLAM